VNLVEGLRSAGVSADRFVLTGDRYSFAGTNPAAITPSKFPRVCGFVRSIRRFDTFVFLANHSFLWGLDLPILRLAGKRVVVVYLGIDSRPPYLDRALLRMGPVRLALRTVGKVAQLRLAEQFATVIVSNPLSSQLHRRPFVSFGAIGLPYPHDLTRVAKLRVSPPLVVHAPTDPGAKGTEPIERVLHRLAEEGVISYRRLEGLPNSEFVREIARASLVIDQLYSDTPAGGVACQSRLAGVPALVFGYGGEAWCHHHPDGTSPPLHHPDHLETVVRDAVQRLRTEDVPAEEFGWTRNYTDRSLVAQRLLTVLAGEAPAQWWCDPRSIRYSMGRGMSSRELSDGLRRYRRRVAPGPLFLRCNPELRTAVEELSKR